VDVGVDEARKHEPVAPVDHAIRRAGRPDVGGPADRNDVAPVDEHGPVGEDAPLGVHGHDDGVLDQDHGSRWRLSWRSSARTFAVSNVSRLSPL
jgi:hypothetical protein